MLTNKTCFMMLSGCGSIKEESAEDTSVHEPVATVQEEVQTGESTEDRIFEYEIRELFTQRDGNQIYGVAYIPLN